MKVILRRNSVVLVIAVQYSEPGEVRVFNLRCKTPNKTKLVQGE